MCPCGGRRSLAEVCALVAEERMSRFASAVLLSYLAVAPSLLAREAPAPLSRPDLIREALDRNPEVQAAARTVEAKRARVAQAGALPDPMLMYGVINEGHAVPFQTLGERRTVSR